MPISWATPDILVYHGQIISKAGPHRPLHPGFGINRTQKEGLESRTSVTQKVGCVGWGKGNHLPAVGQVCGSEVPTP